jgi:branched-chain amino acid aminotransferase
MEKESSMIDMSSFPKAKRYWYMGKFYDWPELTLHPMTHALHYGTSVFEGIRSYGTDRGPSVFRLAEHVERFLYSASVVKMIPPFGKGEITRAIKQTVHENGLDSCYIRPLFFYSYGNLGLVPKASPVQLLIGAWEWGAYLGDKAEAGVSVYLSPWRRVHHSQLDMRAKLGGVYIQSTICGLEARAQGCDEAVFLNLEGRVAEGPGENIFFVKNGVIRTNDPGESVLEGITRTSIIEIARDLGYRVEIGPLAKDEMFAADEVFFTGTAVEVVPIIKILDGSNRAEAKKEYAVGSGEPGPVTQKLRKTYLEIVRGKTPKYKKWLTYVNE